MEKITKYVPALIILLCAFLVVITIGELKGYRYIGGSDAKNQITVTGEGEVFATPDVAEFSFSVVEEAKDVKSAQDAVSKKTEVAINSLKKLGIDEKDIKTTSFNAYPKYQYNEIYCIKAPCPSGKQEIVGYEVNQNITVKVRKIDDSAKAIDAVTTAGASNVSGISFTIDDEDALIRDARKKAIDDAREKAKVLAKDLDVKLVRIVSFNENGGRGVYPMYMKADAVSAGPESAPSVPVLPTGENKISSSVTITYEIR